MRVPSNAFPNELINQLNRLNVEQVRLQKQIASGQKITNANEDPLIFGNALNGITEKRQIQSFQRNLDRAFQVASFTLTTFEQIQTISDRANSIANVTDGLTTSGDFQVRASEVNQLIEQALRIANTQTTGNYIFAGGDVLNRPFVETRDPDGNITSVAYNGTTLPADDVAFNVSEAGKVSPYSPGSLNVELGQFINDLVELRDALLAEDIAAVQAVSPQLDSFDDRLLIAVGEFGAILNRLEIDGKINQSRFNQLERLASSDLDADISEAIVRLNLNQNAYTGALQAGSRVLQLSLLDFIR